MGMENKINADIQELKLTGQLDTNLISDGYHTFGELYEHRITLFITLCRWINMHSDLDEVWRMDIDDGWFLMGINMSAGYQITYHLPESKWEETNFASFMHKEAFQYDGHKSADVLKRLKDL